MSLQISFSAKSAFIILLVLFFSLASGEKVLIMCTQGCGCVTEFGKSVNCPFIRSNQTAVLLATFREKAYLATRIIRFGTVFDFQISTMESLSAFCPDAAGVAPGPSFSICVPAAKPIRTVLNSSFRPKELKYNGIATTFDVEFEDGGTNVEFEVSGSETAVARGDSAMRRLVPFSRPRHCVPMPL